MLGVDGGRDKVADGRTLLYRKADDAQETKFHFPMMKQK